MERIEGQGDRDPWATIRVFDRIGGWGVTAGDFARDLEDLGNVSFVRVLINSGGGDVFDGFAIYNMLRTHSAKVHTRVEGVAASIASIVALAGERVEIHPSAFMMIHNPQGLVVGDAAEMRSFADTLDKVRDPLVAIYAAKMDEDEETIRDLLDDETWYTGNEAVDAGLADDLVAPPTTEGTDDGDDDADKATAETRPDLAACRKVPEDLGGTAAPDGESITDLMRRRVRQSELEVEIDTGV